MGKGEVIGIVPALQLVHPKVRFFALVIIAGRDLSGFVDKEEVIELVPILQFVRSGRNENIPEN